MWREFMEREGKRVDLVVVAVPRPEQLRLAAELVAPSRVDEVDMAGFGGDGRGPGPFGLRGSGAPAGEVDADEPAALQLVDRVAATGTAFEFDADRDTPAAQRVVVDVGIPEELFDFRRCRPDPIDAE